MQSCVTCGMPFEGNHANDIGLETAEGPVCIHDVHDGKVKTVQEIFEGGVAWSMGAVTNGVRDPAERLCRRNMQSLPYWQKRPDPIMQGESVTEEEYQAAFAKL